MGVIIPGGDDGFYEDPASRKEREAERKAFNRQSEYIASTLRLDLKALRDAFGGDRDCLKSYFNMLAEARRDRGFSIAGLALFGAAAVGGLAPMLGAGRLSLLPALVALVSYIGLKSADRRVNDIEGQLSKRIDAYQLPPPSRPPGRKLT